MVLHTRQGRHPHLLTRQIRTPAQVSHWEPSPPLIRFCQGGLLLQIHRWASLPVLVGHPIQIQDRPVPHEESNNCAPLFLG